MQSHTIITCCLLLSIALTSHAEVIYIPGDYSTIQAGIDVASSGDTVLVADGTYTGDGNINLDFKGKAITVTSENGAESTVIDCAGMGRAFYFHSGETPTSVISGFTITNGSPADAYKGVICCIRSSSPTIKDNVITKNMGGGIYCNLESSPIIQNNIISLNSASSGGGIICINSSTPSIQSNHIFSNSATADGGGISCSRSSPLIANNIINDNSAGWYGGGIHINNYSTPFMANNIVSGNSASYGGGIGCGGMNMWTTPPMMIVNTTIVGNSAKGAGGIRLEHSCFSTILNSIIWSNTPDGISLDISSLIDVFYCNIQEKWPGDGNMSANPLFIDPENGDYRLSDYSPCIGAGIRSPEMPNRDILGRHRPYPSYSMPDMGAYENPSGVSHPPWDVNGDEQIDILDLLIVSQHLGEEVALLISPNPDTNGDGIVNILDVVTVAQHLDHSNEETREMQAAFTAKFPNK